MQHCLHLRLNTSHVLIYPEDEAVLPGKSCSLNTSHVLIYQAQQMLEEYYRQLFKYISCSYLSNHIKGGEKHGKGVKYISCSYLSMADTLEGKEKIQFKYISCSYLSQIWLPIIPYKRRLNTSHVLIYPSLYFCRCKKNRRLNTSHVLIYLFPLLIHLTCDVRLNTSHVLIYHNFDLYIYDRIGFKYISCSYLS